MAFEFIKKVFSFGKKAVEEKPAEGEAPAERPAEAAPIPKPQPQPAPEPEKPDEVPPQPQEPARPQEPEPAPEPAPEPEEPLPPQPPGPEIPPGPVREVPEELPETQPEPEVPEPSREVPQPPPEEPPAPAPEVPKTPEPGPPSTPPELEEKAEEPGAKPTPSSSRERGAEGRGETRGLTPLGKGEGQHHDGDVSPATDDANKSAPESEATGTDFGDGASPTRLAPDGAANISDSSTPASSTDPHPQSLPSGGREARPSAPSSPSPLRGGARGGGTADAEPSAEAPGKVTVAKSVERKAEAVPAPAPPEPKKPWFQRLREGLFRSSRELTENISAVFLKRRLDEDTLQDLEDVLLRADLGLETAMRVTDALSAGRYGKEVSGSDVQAVMADEIEKVLSPVALPLELDLSHKPHVILVVGVNGTGKTTTIGKLAAKLHEGGLSVMLAAGDTFRAAAIEQLKIWGERTGSPVVSSKLGADAAGLAWDAYEKAKQDGSDVLIIDTAGRLQNKAELMAELEKIVRVLGKHDPEAPHTVLQTLDATTGQNALNQVEIFRNVAGVNGLVMTKLDGTARGGILVSIAAKHKLPVYFIGVGEQVDDLEPFSASEFARAIAGVA